MLEASALWLVPGIGHPVFSRYADFFRRLFRQFEALDYRAAYLEHGGSGLRERIQRALETTRPQLALYTQFPSSYSYLAPGFIASLRPRCRVVALGFDDEIYFEQAKFFYAHCDAVITTDLVGAERLRSAGIAVHLAALQQPHFIAQESAVREDIGVSFVGDMTKPGRREYLRALESAGIPVSDFGYGSRNGRLSDEQVIDVFRRSRISLNFTRTNPPAWVLRYDPQRSQASQIKGRPFELAALGKFCLCESAPCVDYWFQPGEEIGVFRDGPELVAAARRYLGDDHLRNRIAAAAHERYVMHYAPEVQFQRIFSAILASGQASRRADSIAGEPIFYESIGRSRAAAFLHALRGGRPLRALGETIAGESLRLNYWRGFANGLKDTLAAQLQRS